MRGITANFTAFEECILAFRQDTWQAHKSNAGESHSFMLSIFPLPEKISVLDFEIGPSTQVIVDEWGMYRAHVIRVVNPPWIGRHRSHLFAIAMSAVFSVVYGVPCKSPRDDPFRHAQPGGDSIPDEVVLEMPTISSGTGNSMTSFSQEELSARAETLVSLVRALRGLPPEDCARALRAIRLLHLAHLNVRDDLGLAFALAVGSIETAAQVATSATDFALPLKDESEIERLAASEPAIKELLREYRQLKKQELKLAARFAYFAVNLVPLEEWPLITRHPDQVWANHRRASGVSEHEIARWYQVHASSFGPGIEVVDDAEKMLKKLYRYRSTYVHEGGQPPHPYPDQREHLFTPLVSYPTSGEQAAVMNTAPAHLSMEGKLAWAEKKRPSAFHSRTEYIPTFGLTAALARESICRWVLAGCHKFGARIEGAKPT